MADHGDGAYSDKGERISSSLECDGAQAGDVELTQFLNVLITGTPAQEH